MRALEGRVVEANIHLRDSTLRAPYDGVIAQRFVEVQQNVRAKEPVVRFQDANEIDIAVDVPEAVMAADIRTADIVQMSAEAQRGTRAAISGAGSRNGPGGGPDHPDVQSPRRHEIPARHHRAAGHDGHRHASPIAAPTSWAIGFSSRSRRLFKDWIPENRWRGFWGRIRTVTRRLVKIGEVSGGRIEISGRAATGDRIAVAGVTFLREGMKVRDLGDALGGRQP